MAKPYKPTFSSLSPEADLMRKAAQGRPAIPAAPTIEARLAQQIPRVSPRPALNPAQVRTGSGALGGLARGAGYGALTHGLAQLGESTGIIDVEGHNKAIADSGTAAPEWISIFDDRETISEPSALPPRDEPRESPLSRGGTMDEQLSETGMSKYAGRDTQGRLSFEGPRIMNIGGRTVLTNVSGDDAIRTVNNSNVRNDLPAYRSGGALGGGPVGGQSELERVQDKYGDTAVDRRMAGKTYDFGREFKPRGFGGLAALAYKNKMEARDMAWAKEDRRDALAEGRLDREDRRLDLEESRAGREASRHAALDPVNIAKAQQDILESEARIRNTPSKPETDRTNKILSLYAKLTSEKLDDDQKAEISEMIAILEAGGVPSYRKPQAKIPARGNWNLFVDDVPEVPAIPGGYFDISKK